MSKEATARSAMKRTVDKIKSTFWEGYLPEPDKRQQALDKKAENARELGLMPYNGGDYEPAQQCKWPTCQSEEYQQALAEQIKRELVGEQPAQQEPVATDWERIARVQDAKLRAMCNESGGFEKLCEVMDRYEHTSPPAQRTWQGLTDKEMNAALDYWSEDERSAYGGAHAADGEYVSMIDTWRYIEAKLKEKNNG